MKHINNNSGASFFLWNSAEMYNCAIYRLHVKSTHHYGIQPLRQGTAVSRGYSCRKPVESEWVPTPVYLLWTPFIYVLQPLNKKIYAAFYARNPFPSRPGKCRYEIVTGTHKDQCNTRCIYGEPINASVFNRCVFSASKAVPLVQQQLFLTLPLFVVYLLWVNSCVQSLLGALFSSWLLGYHLTISNHCRIAALCTFCTGTLAYNYSATQLTKIPPPPLFLQIVVLKEPRHKSIQSLWVSNDALNKHEDSHSLVLYFPQYRFFGNDCNYVWPINKDNLRLAIQKRYCECWQWFWILFRRYCKYPQYFVVAGTDRTWCTRS